MTATPIISVLLAEDHIMVRQGLKSILEAENDIKVIGEASTGRQAVAMHHKLRPDVTVMDIAMPILNGLEATRQILAATPDARIIILSAHSDDAYVERVTELGASGYLIKQTSSLFLSEAIRQVNKGNTYFSPSISKQARRLTQTKISGKGQTEVSSVRLSTREAEVLQMIAEGEANKQIAAELGISVKTVEKHRANLMLKLDIHETAGLTRYAIEAGIIESGVHIPLAT